jgi:predicted DNA-binding transcriptional regulator AlpA
VTTPINPIKSHLRRAPYRAAPAAIPLDGFLRLPQVLAIVPVSRSTWLAGIKSGRFPTPVRLGARCVAWRAADIRRLIESLDSGAE